MSAIKVLHRWIPDKDKVCHIEGLTENHQVCTVCGIHKFTETATTASPVLERIRRKYVLLDGRVTTNRPDCILKINPVELMLDSNETSPRKPSNKELADSMVIEFKEKMDSHAVDPAIILEGIRKKYLSEADEKLDELQKQKEHWLTLKHNLSK